MSAFTPNRRHSRSPPRQGEVVSAAAAAAAGAVPHSSVTQEQFTQHSHFTSHKQTHNGMDAPRPSPLSSPSADLDSLRARVIQARANENNSSLLTLTAAGGPSNTTFDESTFDPARSLRLEALMSSPTPPPQQQPHNAAAHRFEPPRSSPVPSRNGSTIPSASPAHSRVTSASLMELDSLRVRNTDLENQLHSKDVSAKLCQSPPHTHPICHTTIIISTLIFRTILFTLCVLCC